MADIPIQYPGAVDPVPERGPTWASGPWKINEIFDWLRKSIPVLQRTLGANPQGSASSVRARLEGIENGTRMGSSNIHTQGFVRADAGLYGVSTALGENVAGLTRYIHGSSDFTFSGTATASTTFSFTGINQILWIGFVPITSSFWPSFRVTSFASTSVPVEMNVGSVYTGTVSAYWAALVT